MSLARVVDDVGQLVLNQWATTPRISVQDKGRTRLRSRTFGPLGEQQAHAPRFVDR